MKAYKESFCYCGEMIEIEVLIPTPKELQSAKVYNHTREIKIVVSNFSGSRGDSYSVAMFEVDKENAAREWSTPESARLMKFEARAKAKNVYSFTGKDARRQAIEMVRDFVADWH